MRRGIKSCQVQSFLRDDPRNGGGRTVALLIPLPAANFSPILLPRSSSLRSRPTTHAVIVINYRLIFSPTRKNNARHRNVRVRTFLRFLLNPFVRFEQSGLYIIPTRRVSSISISATPHFSRSDRFSFKDNSIRTSIREVRERDTLPNETFSLLLRRKRWQRKGKKGEENMFEDISSDLRFRRRIFTYRFCVICEETLDALLKIPLGNWRSLGKFDRA